jgi:hypothetical protein
MPKRLKNWKKGSLGSSCPKGELEEVATVPVVLTLTTAGPKRWTMPLKSGSATAGGAEAVAAAGAGDGAADAARARPR